MAQQLGSNYYNSPYKFNGKELDEETGLYYYGARYYDPRISIWQSVDPLAEKYPGMSPYVYCANNPILYKDPDGRDIVIYYRDKDSKGNYVGREHSYKYSYEKGRKMSSIANNKFLRNTVKMLDKLVSTGATKNLQISGDKGENCGDRILQVVKDPRQLSIIEVKNKESVGSLYSPSTYTGENKRPLYGNENGLGTIKLNDEFGSEINTSSDNIETNSPTALLGHEIIHEEHFKNDFDRFSKERVGHPKGGNKEERLTTKEANQINSALGEPIRNEYSGGKNIPMCDPTINKKCE